MAFRTSAGKDMYHPSVELIWHFINMRFELFVNPFLLACIVVPRSCNAMVKGSRQSRLHSRPLWKDDGDGKERRLAKSKEKATTTILIRSTTTSVKAVSKTKGSHMGNTAVGGEVEAAGEAIGSSVTRLPINQATSDSVTTTIKAEVIKEMKSTTTSPTKPSTVPQAMAMELEIIATTTSTTTTTTKRKAKATTTTTTAATTTTRKKAKSMPSPKSKKKNSPKASDSPIEGVATLSTSTVVPTSTTAAIRRTTTTPPLSTDEATETQLPIIAQKKPILQEESRAEKLVLTIPVREEPAQPETGSTPPAMPTFESRPTESVNGPTVTSTVSPTVTSLAASTVISTTASAPQVRPTTSSSPDVSEPANDVNISLTASGCSLTVSEYLARMRTALVRATDSAELDVLGTPQNKALDWLTGSDLERLCPDAINLVQRYVMAVLYFSLNGDSWNECSRPSSGLQVDIGTLDAQCSITANVPDDRFRPNPWTESSLPWLVDHECFWAGVSCNGIDFTIQRIEIVGNNAFGSIPGELGLLERLRFLTISDADLSGTVIPSELEDLDLNGLCLENDNLIGTVPSGIVAPKLLKLALHGNILSPPVPSDFDSLSQ